MEEFKARDQIYEADERWDYVSRLTLEEWYAAIEAIVLRDAVPEEIRSQFNVAKMLCVYCWNYYPFHQIAELKSFATAESALREKYPNLRNYKDRMLAAIRDGLLMDCNFSGVGLDDVDPTRYAKVLADVLPQLRNDLAHGSNTLHAGSFFTLRRCAEIINQLF